MNYMYQQQLIRETYKNALTLYSFKTSKTKEHTIQDYTFRRKHLRISLKFSGRKKFPRTVQALNCKRKKKLYIGLFKTLKFFSLMTVLKMKRQGIPQWSSGQNSVLSLLRVQVLSLVRELRSHTLCSVAKINKFFTIILKFFLFIYFWLHWVFVAACLLSLVAVHGLLIAVASRCRAQALGTQASVVATHGLSNCGLGVQQLWHTGLVALWHV